MHQQGVGSYMYLSIWMPICADVLRPSNEVRKILNIPLVKEGEPQMKGLRKITDTERVCQNSLQQHVNICKNHVYGDRDSYDRTSTKTIEAVCFKISISFSVN